MGFPYTTSCTKETAICGTSPSASPRELAGWIVIEERSEGGDALYLEAQKRPAFLRGFDRVAEGGGAALYRATKRASRQ